MKKCPPEERPAELRKAKDSAKKWARSNRTWDYTEMCELLPHRSSRIALVNELLRRGFFIKNKPQESELAVDLSSDAATTSAGNAVSTSDASTSTADDAVSTSDVTVSTSAAATSTSDIAVSTADSATSTSDASVPPLLDNTMHGQPPCKKARVDAGFPSGRVFCDRKPSARKVARLIEKEGWKANHPKPEDIVNLWRPF